MLGNLSEKFENALRHLSGKAEISEENVREAMDDVRTALLEADVHYEVAETFCDHVLKEATGEQVLKAVQPGEQMIKIVNDELIRLLGGDEALAASKACKHLNCSPIMVLNTSVTGSMTTCLIHSQPRASR